MINEFYDPELYDARVGDVLFDDSIVTRCQERAGNEPQRVLDIGAGTGRLAIPLLRAGHRVICIDQSSPMLDKLRENVSRVAPELFVALETSHGAFSTRKFEAPVDAAFAIDDFLLHFTTQKKLSLFFSALRSWLKPKPEAFFFTDIRPRSSSELLAQSRMPLTVRTFGLSSSNRDANTPRRYGMMFWEQYEPISQELTTTCQYQTINLLGEVERTYYRVLHQRVHTTSDVIMAAEREGFQLVEHSTRKNQGANPNNDIGGEFEFRLKIEQALR